ncbi:MAG: rhodanese-like domain-containing protein, partial [Verrucomicrobiota bacterium]
LLPLSELPQRFTELDPNQQYYLHCKGGVRSMKAVNFLRQQGFKCAASLIPVVEALAINHKCS